MVLEARGHARKADAGLPVRDAESGRPPETVLSLLHIAEVVAEVHDSRTVTFIEEDTAPKRVLRDRGIRCRHRSGVANAGVLRQEEARQQTVHAQESIAGQRNRFVGDRLQIPLGLQRLELIAEAFEHIDAILVTKIGGRDRSQLQLKDELVDEALSAGRPICATEGRLAATNRSRIRLPRIEVLNVDTVDVTEGR